MNKFYVVDYHLKKYYGPFKNCKKAKQAARFVKEVEVSDLLLEIGTNVVITDGLDSISSDFIKEDIEKLKEQVSYGEE